MEHNATAITFEKNGDDPHYVWVTLGNLEERNKIRMLMTILDARTHINEWLDKIVIGNSIKRSITNA